ncbi:beta strand repeat-containing protein [Verrucomicrobium spinosum]|uniref:beta strand repeat-containing protein n=1 Tax=Verrucomicrobium spinosum TaxID=2736 RepID=UPI0009467ECB|nr:autotransporter-associated beta strand repeat-containing protein [Verrucomicrobium spinosum]
MIDPSGAVTIRAVNNSSRVIDLIGTGGATTIDMSAATQDLTFANNGSGVMTLNVASGDQTWNVKTGRTLTTSAVSGSTSFVVTLTGGGTVVIGGTSDNGNGRFATAAGSATVVFLAKNSSASVHALGGNAVSSIGAGTEMRITGTGGDQIFYQTDLLVDGKFDLNGKSEGLDALSSGSGVASGVITSAVAGAVTLRINEGGGGGTYGGIMEDGLGALTLVKASTGTQILAGASTYTGSTTVSRGILQLIGANGALANTSSIIIDGFGELRLDSRTASNGFGAAANLNRVNNAASISLRGGVLSLYGLTTAAVTEELGAVSIANGVSHIRLSSDSAAGANVTGLTVSDLSRSAGSQVVFFGENATGFGTVNSGANDVVYFRVTTGAISAAELSGAGGTGTDRDLYIGAFGSVSTSTTTGTEFMTLETVGGYDYLRPLTSGEYAVLTSGQIGEHVAQQSANTTLSANTAYNALKITAGNTLIGANKTLYLGGHAAGADANPTVTEGSGMLIANGNSNILGLRSALDFSGREAMIRVTTGTLNIESSITGTAGLSKLGNGALNLTGRNTFTGDVYVNEGILQVRNDLGLGGSGTVYVNGTAGTNLLQLTNGINVKGRDVVLGVSNGSATVGFKSNAGHNTWDGDVIVGNVGLGGNSSTPSYLQVSNNAALTIYGDVYGKRMLR